MTFVSKALTVAAVAFVGYYGVRAYRAGAAYGKKRSEILNQYKQDLEQERSATQKDPA